MSRLNYLAIMCDDPQRMRDWYQRWFGMEEDQPGRRKARSTSPTATSTVGLLKRGSAPGEEDQHRGVHHFGFQIDDIMEIERNLEDFDPSLRLERRPSEDPYAEYRLTDPEGIVVDLSERGYGVDGEPRNAGYPPPRNLQHRPGAEARVLPRRSRHEGRHAHRGGNRGTDPRDVRRHHPC
jgi:catechol 2,3-dioxygenase-like lactoylglutathione lyase family enzyme